MLVQVLVKPEIPLWSKPQSERRAGMCVQDRWDRCHCSNTHWVSCQWCRESLALVRAMGRCVPEPGGVVLGSLLPRD